MPSIGSSASRAHAERASCIRSATERIASPDSSVTNSTAGKKLAAVGLARLAADDAARQALLCDAGIIGPLVKWLVRNEDKGEDDIAVDKSLRSVAAL